VNHHGPASLSVGYDGIRWIHCGEIEAPAGETRAYDQTLGVLRGMRRELERAGGAIDDVVRTWFYQGGITAETDGVQRYHELNRARADLYGKIRFGRALMRGQNGHVLYPASTGIGMQGRGLTAGCLALKTDRRDVGLVGLENPGQLSAYRYEKKYSPDPPRFSRAMAVLLGDYVTTWISGTASIVNSESCFPGDIECQTHQTLDNIERLIAPENFALHGVARAGASLQDLAKVRVYVKRPEDYARCRAVCEQRLGHLPAIYAIADICRPELLVEIEGVTFSPLGEPPPQFPEVGR
jgi:enamine deaminase RidA (YjgF/YER057c/UK114 family)